MKLKFGSETEINELDKEGSFVATETKVQNGEPMPAQYKRFCIRTRVTDKREELAEYLKFSDMLFNNQNLYSDFNWRYEGHLFDPAFTIKKRKSDLDKGYYYVVKTWTEKLN